MAAITSTVSRLEPMRGISIIIESPEVATATATATAATQVATTAKSNSNTEMSLKSQAGMLLAFGDTPAAAATTKDNLETSYDTAATSAATAASAASAATATPATTKIYPQLLLRIGGEIAGATAIATPTTTAATSPTIISCNGEIAASQPAATAADTAATLQHNNTVKIQIESQGQPRILGKQISVVKLNEGVEEMQWTPVATSGQYSPCETLDSGTGSDLEGHHQQQVSHQQQLQQLKSPQHLELHLQTTRLKVKEEAEEEEEEEEEDCPLVTPNPVTPKIGYKVLKVPLRYIY